MDWKPSFVVMMIVWLFSNFEMEPAVKSMSYVSNLIEKQTQYIKKSIHQSHLMHIQADMEKELFIYLKGDCEYESDALCKHTCRVDTASDIYDIEEALDNLYGEMFDIVNIVDNAYDEEYETVKFP